MKYLSDDYFTFSKSERNGLVVLLIIIISLAIYNFYLSYAENELTEIDLSAFEKEILAFEKRFKTLPKTNFFSNSKRYQTQQPVLFEFDPNTISLEKLKLLGLEPKVAYTIINYRNNGGVFKVKADLQKIYGMTEKDFHRLNSFIKLPEQLPGKEEFSIEARNERPGLIDINTADAAELQQISGIGPTYSERIIRYRNKLGGFYHIEQLREVYGVDEELFNKVRDKLTISDSAIGKMDINRCSAKDLMSHPYITDWNVANSIISYRDVHGNYKRVKDLKKLYMVTDSLYGLLEHYLKIK